MYQHDDSVPVPPQKSSLRGWFILVKKGQEGHLWRPKNFVCIKVMQDEG